MAEAETFVKHYQFRIISTSRSREAQTQASIYQSALAIITRPVDLLTSAVIHAGT